jgi:hypothetical protein
MTDAGNSETNRGEQASGLARYDKRMEELVEAFSDQVERVGGKALDELAAVAKSFAERLEEVAEQARRKREMEKTTGE